MSETATAATAESGTPQTTNELEGAAPGTASSGEGAGDSAATKNNKAPAVSPAQNAYNRARARFNDAAKSTQDSSTVSGKEQAPGGNKAAGESTQKPVDGNNQTTDKEKTGASGGDESPNSDSILKAPDDWPKEHRERFERLPDNEARQLVLDQYKDFQRGLTKATTDIARIRESHGNLVNAMTKHGMDSDRVIELLDTASAYKDDPRGTISQLAQQAGIEIFFERPLAEGEIPSFDNPKDLAKWSADQAYAKIKKENEERERRETEKKQKETESARAEEQKKALALEFRKATEDHPDFNDHKSAVIEHLSRLAEHGPSVQDSYRLATYDGLRKLAEEGMAAKKELAALKAKMDKQAKISTSTPKGASSAGKEAPPAEDKHLTPGQRAFRKAQQRISAAKNAATT
jgi:hypothetical protein